MATLITAQDISKSYSTQTLFTGVSVQLAEEDRLGFIGPNGAGKSTLLKILAGLETADEGKITRRRGLRQVYVKQDDIFPDDATPLSAVMSELDSEAAGERVDEETRALIVLSKLGFDDVRMPVRILSGGWRKRLSIACALAHDPEILLLDEPTNHLDLEGIVWLEQFIQQSRMAIVIITHDRRFLENAAKRIIELSPAYPGGTFEVQGNYTEFVRRKDAFLDAQAIAESALANKVRRDNAWLKQGIQGRQTRNKSQVSDTDSRRGELKSIKTRNLAPSLTASIEFQATERKTKKLMTLFGITKSMGDKKLFESIDIELSPRKRIGLLGPNGSGKTTMLRLMNDELQPDAGSIKRADALKVIKFSQHRETLDDNQTLQEAMCPVGDMVDYRGKQVHVTGWAKRFLFDREQLSTFVRNLSGGEQARLLIARLMLEPADVLLLDEPTNDLDIPSLEVLEQALLEFPGAIVLVTHDRFLLERVSTEFLALDGAGSAKTHASYVQYLEAAMKQAKARKRETAKTNTSGSRGDNAPRRSAKPGKLSYKLQRELDGMELAILDAESDVERLERESGDSTVLADHGRLATICHALGEAQTLVLQLYDRWAELEALAAGGAEK